MSEPAGIAEGMIERTASILRALAHPLRLRIIDRLMTSGTATPNELAEHFGESQQNVSKHLKTLSQADIVERRKEGSSAFYSVRDDAIGRILAETEGLARRVLVEMSARAGFATGSDGRAPTG